MISILRVAYAGTSARELFCKHTLSDATFYLWLKNYAGVEVHEVKHLRTLKKLACGEHQCNSLFPLRNTR
ncbi:hypothetical protein ITX54_07240 [Rouxiella silvae]|uniref:Transposase n=1 Tax=Rouxiella silvae TaxID=1646373 RepID=A0AA41BW35_9GAMM|nr:hypothetical protein [Rouxiella silvae]